MRPGTPPEKSEHRRVGHVVPNQTRFHVREGVLQIGQGGEHEERTRPTMIQGQGTEDGDVEEERAGQRASRLSGRRACVGRRSCRRRVRRQDTMDHHWTVSGMTSTARAGPQSEKSGSRLRVAFLAGEQAVESADFGVFEGEPRGGDRPGHGDSELDEIGDQDAPELQGVRRRDA